MNLRHSFLTIWFLTWIFGACAPLPDFPFPGATIIENQPLYNSLRKRPKDFQGRRVQLAGRIIYSETTSKGVTVLAEWLPFPEDTFAGPETRSTFRSVRPFYMDYEGPIDHDGRRQGNEFLIVGTMTGLGEMVTLHGLTKSIPAFRVQCMHVWKTAGTDLYEFIWTDPTDDRYPPPLEETYCVSSHSSIQKS